MRWPIRLQLLLPMLVVVVLAVVLASLACAYFDRQRAREAQQQSLRRVVTMLTQAPFPLTKSVLRQMSDLSGAEFIVLDARGNVAAGTLQASAAELRPLLAALAARPANDESAGQPHVLDGRAYLCQQTPVLSHSAEPSAGTLLVLYPEDRWATEMRQAAYPALLAGGAAAVVAILMTTLLASRFVGPIRRLVAQTAVIAQGDFQPLSVDRRNDELRDLAAAINQMAQRLSKYAHELRRNEQLRTVGQLGAGMAHQLRNAATGASMAIELHQRHCPAAESDDSLAVALRQLRLMESYLRRFLTLGRPQHWPQETLPLAEPVDDAITLVRPTCGHAGIELTRIAGDEHLLVRGERDALCQLTLNLLLNAVEAIQAAAATPATIAVEIHRSGESQVSLVVRDSGPGLAAEVAARLFEPFVTGKPEGTGLGLFVARQIVEAHNGTITCRRHCGQTCFVVELPLAKPTSPLLRAGEGPGAKEAGT